MMAANPSTSHSFTSPVGCRERIRKVKVGKTHGLRWRQFSKWRKRRGGEELNGSDSVTTSHHQNDAQSVCKKLWVWKICLQFDCWAWRSEVWNISLVLSGQLSQPLVHSSPTCWGAAWDTDKALMLWKHCSATANSTLVCYDHCFGHIWAAMKRLTPSQQNSVHHHMRIVQVMNKDEHLNKSVCVCTTVNTCDYILFFLVLNLQLKFEHF